MDYNGRQSAIYRLRTLNSRSVLAHADIVTDQETIAKAQLNILMRTRTRRSAAPRKASWPASLFFFNLCRSSTCSHFVSQRCESGHGVQAIDQLFG